MVATKEIDEPCCGPPQGPPSSPFERPGYTLCHYVDSFNQTAVGLIPRVKTSKSVEDYLGSVRARLGISRDRYRVAPGLYSFGTAGPNSPVLVSANYKLSFDALRSQMAGVDAWLLVLDTRGINVWCAAGKRTFSTEEIIRQVQAVQLDKVVKHRELILPQLGAPGVSGHLVKKGCGFKVIWGPIRARDVREFIAGDRIVLPAMRQLSFSMWERLVLVPVEISLILKPSFWIILCLFVISGIGPDLFSVSQAWQRGGVIVAAYIMGVVAGAVFVPALLQWLPGVSFYVKGVVSGAVLGTVAALRIAPQLLSFEAVAAVLVCVAVSSYAAMNFTGATPFASPSGVEKEMRVGIPLQAVFMLAAAVLWVGAPFWGG